MTFKKIASIITAGLMTLSCTGISEAFDFRTDAVVFAASYQGSGTYEDLSYENYGSYVEITECDKSATAVKIPDEIDGVKVTRIQEYAFSDCSSLKSVYIPRSVHSIKAGAFAGCVSLESINLPQGIRYIDCYTFYNCTSLTGISIPDSVAIIDDMSFYGCFSLKKITIPDSVTYIGSLAFAQDDADKSSLTDLKLSENLVYIGSSAFADCKKLTDIKIPDSVRELYMDSFIGCDSEESLSVPLTASILSARHVNYNYEKSGDNISRNDIDYHYIETSDKSYAKRYDSPMYSNLFRETDGSLTRVHYYYGRVFIENYNDDWTVKKRTVIKSELSEFGGFYCGEKYNFIVFGQDCPDIQTVNDDFEVIRIIKYSKDWKRQGSASFSMSQTDACAPFDAGSLRMAEYGGNLLLHTSRQMYHEYPHQSNLTVCINEETMSSDGINLSSPYSSHSFGQFVKTDNEYAYFVDHGDAYPRAVLLSRSGLTPDVRDPGLKSNEVLKIQGETGDNFTGLSVGGFELSGSSCLIAGNSVDHSNSQSYDLSGVKNIFLCVSDKDLKDTKQIWITDYAKDDGVTVRTPQLVRINDDKFVLMWEELYKDSVTTKTAQVNGSGKLISGIETQNVRLSDCHPVLDKEGFIVWYVTDEKSTLTFYRIDPDNLNEKAEEITAAHPGDCISEEFDPLSDPHYLYDYEISDDCVSIITLAKPDNILGSGITDLKVPQTIDNLPVTEICAGAFSQAGSLVSVSLPDSIETIGNSAFSGCNSLVSVNIPEKVSTINSYTFLDCNLKSLVIPASVRYIGRYAVGYEYKIISNGDGSYSYTIEKDNDFTAIIGLSGTAAQDYARLNNISFKELETGDVNNDGNINITDAVMIKRWILCSGSMPSLQAADLNHDGTVNIFDLMRLMQMLTSH
ncbi:MAG: leucine-rich repeat protein [Oscillospiraceae bacterium]|nr:leucine-rich repeat protein [Oscillospiraceae bacterium]